MTDDQWKSAFNVLCGLNSDGLNRYEEAEAFAKEAAAKGNNAPMEALAEVRRRIAEYDDYTGACIECKSWDGVSRRCSCGNRRVYWEYHEGIGFLATEY